MTQLNCTLPEHKWYTLDKLIRAIGERKTHITEGISDYYSHFPYGGTAIQDIEFLKQSGFIHGESPYKLTKTGKRYFELRFIKNQPKEARLVLRDQLLSFPPTELIIQLLWGVPQIKKSNVNSLLSSQGKIFNLYGDNLDTFVKLLNHAGVISYNRLTRGIRVLVKPTAEETPQNVFIAPETPYSNIMWLQQILSECQGFIYWFDKHFFKIGLKYIWEIADGTRVQHIHILSLELEDNLNQAAKDEYNRLRKELKRKHISLEWRVIESQKIRDTHDRWIIGKNCAYNVPDINSIHSGKRSELIRSSNHKEVLKTFLYFWDIATPA